MSAAAPDPTPPSPEDLAAYRRGALDLARFDAIDAWLATRPTPEQERLLGGEEDTAGRGLALELGNPAPAAAFTSDGGAERYIPVSVIGSGGMGIVQVVRDATLGREVALKVCRPRAGDEDLEAYLRRLRAFRREAAVTAQLEHPAIVPVHDLGRGPAGEPAYLMKRLIGTPLTERVERIRSGMRCDLSETVEIMLRIAEAMAHAHAGGVVHRDLKPENVFVGALGAVSVIDWGLAGRPGEAPSALGPATGAGSGLTRFGAGTARWMPSEQVAGAAADARMDVFALGGLLMALLTGCPPRDDQGRLNLAPLRRRGVARGLAAVAERCLAEDPADRYADGAAVALELRRWLAAGLTLAQRASLPRRAWAYLRTSPQLVTIVVLGALVAGTLTVTQVMNQRAYRREVALRLDDLAQTPLTDLSALRLAQGEVRAALAAHASAKGLALEARLGAAIETIERQAATDNQRQRLRAVFSRYRQRGQSTSDIADLSAALGEAGVRLAGAPGEAQLIREHPLRFDLLEALVQLQKHLILDAADDARRAVIPGLIASAGADDAWRALGALLERPEVEAHDLRFCRCADSEMALRDPRTADLLLMTYGPEPRLIEHARERLNDDPGAFWPRIVSARGALRAKRFDEARDHALVALGTESKGFWPNLLLAYVALGQHDDAGLAAHVAAGLAINPGQSELVALEAVRLARSGRAAAALELVAAPQFAAHLQYHLQHPVGHPMEDSARALVEAGVAIPAAPALLGPLLPTPAHHH